VVLHAAEKGTGPHETDYCLLLEIRAKACSFEANSEYIKEVHMFILSLDVLKVLASSEPLREECMRLGADQWLCRGSAASGSCSLDSRMRGREGNSRGSGSGKQRSNGSSPFMASGDCGKEAAAGRVLESGFDGTGGFAFVHY